MLVNLNSSFVNIISKYVANKEHLSGHGQYGLIINEVKKFNTRQDPCKILALNVG